jgi:FRG domain
MNAIVTTQHYNFQGNVKNIIEYIKLVQEKCPGFSYFRGQGDKNWSLNAGYYRDTYFSGLHDEKFYRAIRKKRGLNSEIALEDLASDLIELQHYGFPTRLLDWTKNPLTALFFACSDTSQLKVDGAVYFFLPGILPQIHISRALKSDWDHLGKPMTAAFTLPPETNSRIFSQEGCFVVQSKTGWPSDAFQENNISQILIPAKHKIPILKELNKIGFHYAKLFPDLDGIARFVKFASETQLERAFNHVMDAHWSA